MLIKVWLRDPFKYLLDLNQDVIFMDDGQKSPRYTPFYVNSGFYFVRHNLRTLYLFEKMMKCGASEIGLHLFQLFLLSILFLTAVF